MNIALIVAIVLAAAVLLSVARTWRVRVRHRASIVGLQIAAAALLYLCLFPPTAREDFALGQLVVLTPGTTPAQLATLSSAAALASTTVALPGAPEWRDAERVPDLGTALRRHPDAHHLHIVGAGLPQRDRDVARGMIESFDAAPLLKGLVELDAPVSVNAGGVWRIGGRVEQAAEGRVELRDPSGAVAGAAPLDAQGRFALQASAKGAGAALFTLKVFDKNAALVGEIAVPLVARSAEPLKVLLLAGAPDAELKYLRRWAIDAGMQLDSRMSLSEGIALTEGAPALDANAFHAADVAIIDERAWAALDTTQKHGLHDAVRDGLGLLLRATGPLAAPVAEDWAALGFRTQATETASAVSLDRTLGLSEFGLAFAKRSLSVEAVDAAPLLHADDGTPLALWRNEGRGRVALWWLTDSYRLGLSGARAQFGTLWSDALSKLARARGTPPPQLPSNARVDQRAVLCNLDAAVSVESEQHARVELVVEPATSERGCAGYWPAEAGWHTLIADGQRWPFYVRASTEASALRSADDARATRALIDTSSTSSATEQRSIALPRWPFFLSWLVAIVVLWWIERRSAAIV